jgi:hypothetical protein
MGYEQFETMNLFVFCFFLTSYNQNFEFSSLFLAFTSIRQLTKQVIGVHGVGSKGYSNFLAEIIINILRLKLLTESHKPNEEGGDKN